MAETDTLAVASSESQPSPGDILVSIIFPVFNASKYLDEAIESICRQTHRKLEICIVDDGSNDNSVEMLHKWIPILEAQGFMTKLQLCETQTVKATQGHWPPGHGCGIAKNKAIALSSAPYICFFDSDDVMFPRRFEQEWNVELMIMMMMG